MNIINILLSDKNGGVEQSFVNYCIMLQQNDCKILAIIKQNAEFIPDLQKNNINFIEVKNKFGYHDIFSILRIRKIIKNFKTNRVIAHAGRSIIIAKKALNFLKIPLIAVNHSNNIKRSLKADIIFAVNNNIINKIQQTSSHKNYHLIPNSIAIDKKIEAKELTISKRKTITLGSMGRLAQEKNFDGLITIIKFLKDQNYKIKLKIAGTGQEENNLKNLVKNLNLEKNIEFLGWVDQKTFFEQIDIFILLSKEETFGMVFLEASKYQKLIIASNTDGATMLLKHQENAIIIDQNKNISQQIINNLQFLQKNPELISTIIKNSYQNLCDNYSNKVIRKKILNIT
ncbi:glycosyltransferase [Rickettsiales bacterium]|nr:glycosyltransferase [Rickettsiales bacterium]